MFRNIFLTLLLFIIFNSCISQQGNNEIIIPFESYEDWIFVKAKLNDSIKLDLMFDTGFNTTLLNSTRADKLNMIPDGKAEFFGAIGEDSLYYFVNNNLMIGKVKLDKLQFIKAPLEDMELKFGKSIDGMVGYDFLKGRIVRLNFDKNCLEIFDKFEDIKTKPQNYFSITMRDNIPSINAILWINKNDTVRGNFILDTGYNSSLVVGTPFVNKYNLLEKVKNTYKFNSVGILTSDSRTFKARIHKFSFCGYDFFNMPVTFSQATTGTLSESEYDGMIGTEVLKRFNIIFDYQNSRIYLEDNKSYKESYRVNCSGMEVKLSKNRKKVIIHDVYANSPASEAKLKKGDEIIKIEGKQAEKLKLTEIKKMLREKGHSIEITVRDSNETRTIQLKLRELI
ncbi:MAG: aspartyl protease family protein [Bacteroidota bacterium]|nr:aspartyl protease family protein [Bacteroidota bacterium]